MLTTKDIKVLKELFVTKEEFRMELRSNLSALETKLGNKFSSNIETVRNELIVRMDENTDKLRNELIIRMDENTHKLRNELIIRMDENTDKLRNELIVKMDENTDLLVEEIKSLISMIGTEIQNNKMLSTEAHIQTVLVKDHETRIQNLEQRNN